jgi:hypothetical protein
MTIWSDKGVERRIYRPLGRRVPQVDVDAATAQFVCDIAAEHPKFTPEEVHVVIRHEHRRNDITMAMVRYVLLGGDHD